MSTVASSSSSTPTAPPAPLHPTLQAQVVPLAKQFNTWLRSFYGVAMVAMQGPKNDFLQSSDAMLRALQNDDVSYLHDFAHILQHSVQNNAFAFMLQNSAVFCVSPAAWSTASEKHQEAMLGIVTQLCRMADEYQTFYDEVDQLNGVLNAQGQLAQMKSSIESSIPDEFRDKLQAFGGIDGIMQKFSPIATTFFKDGIPPQLLELIGGPNGGVAGIAGLLGGLGGTMQKYKGALARYPENGTSHQTDEFYKSFCEMLEADAIDDKSILHKVLRIFQVFYPDGLEIGDMGDKLNRVKGLMMVAGAKPDDTAWRILRKLRQYLLKLAKKCKDSPRITHDTLIKKVFILGRMILDKKGEIDELTSLGMNSKILQSIAGQFLNMPMDKITKDPFGGDGGGGGGSGAIVARRDDDDSDWDDDDNAE